ncbi:MAG: ABC transporter substrate-binding protein, partial [Actinomycetia bacterium]|nr:ABC transporter substrate-binding protein [Actinomycetes bacterium]
GPTPDRPHTTRGTNPPPPTTPPPRPNQTQKDNSRGRSDDGLTWTFYLRRDVTWHDGQGFTAQDVDFTFNRIIYNDEIPASSRPTFTFRFPDAEGGGWQEAPMSVTALDAYTVQFVLSVPFAPFLRSMGTATYPKHILEPHVEDGTFVSTWDIDTDPAAAIGTGPFTIERWDRGEPPGPAAQPELLAQGRGGQPPALSGPGDLRDRAGH